MPEGDSRLHAYVCANDEDSEEVLSHLCAETLLPVCLAVVRARLWRHNEDVQDVVHDVLIRLIPRLREIRASGDPSSVRDAASWAMGAASKACSDFLRKEHPIRTHLAVSLRYRFQKSVVFSLWKASNGRMVCGWRRCHGVPPLTEPALREVFALPRVSARLTSIEPQFSANLWRALARVFACANGPIYFQALISELLNRSTSGGEGGTCSLDRIAEPPSDAGADTPLIQKSILKTLWQSIMTLSFEQRCALLLNLRGPEGLPVWWHNDVVTRAEIAASVGLAPEELDCLPLSDLEIADRLRLTEPDQTKRRQCVINLRRTAKRQLTERLDASQICAPTMNMPVQYTSY